MSGVRLETPETGPGTRSSEADSQATRALDALRASLLSGEFAPGERMAELSLVARLGVSRTPIRLALERLAHMGLLDLNASGGFTVRGYTRAEALDAIEIRGVLEGTRRGSRPNASPTAPKWRRSAASARRWTGSNA